MVLHTYMGDGQKVLYLNSIHSFKNLNPLLKDVKFYRYNFADIN